MGVPDLDPVSCVRAADADQLRAWLDGAGLARLELDGTSVSGGRELWDAAAAQLPIPPSIAPYGWDSFKDAMFEAVTSVGEPNVALVWEAVDDLVAADLQDFLVAASVLEHLATEMTRDHSVRFLIFAVGEGAGYRALAQLLD
jgi:hypothetical protein